MSILIKDMEMPKNCDECRFCVNGFTDDAPMYECAVQSYENVSVLVESGGKPFDFRPDWCPLTELPPHGRLVDADKLMMSIADWWYSSFGEEETDEAKAIRKVLDTVEQNIGEMTVVEAEGERNESETV